MKFRIGFLVIAAWLPAKAAVFHVGPGMPYEKPSAVAAVARDGDTIEIEMANYDGDVAVWTQNDLTIRGIGGRPRLRARGRAAEGKAIWVIKGNNTVVENIEFSGARVPDLNGAGIRLEGANITVRNCYFHDNENGILTGANPDSAVLVEHSEFSNNGAGDGYSHNIYVGRIAKFTIKFSYLHHAHIGHQVKSRAAENRILFNRVMDGVTGTSSYLIDLPDPGTAFIVGNELQQGPDAENRAMINAVQRIHLVNNTFVNDRGSGVFVQLHDDGSASIIQNNIFAGSGRFALRGAVTRTNLVAESAGLAGRARFDYSLNGSSKAIDAGLPVDPSFESPLPAFEYAHPANGIERRVEGPIDIGAHEFRADGGEGDYVISR